MSLVLRGVRVIDGLGHVRERGTILIQNDRIAEIGGGLGELLGKVWRIGLMGESSTQANVMTLLSALETIFLRQKWIPQPGIALKAASGVYASQEWEANA